MNTLRVGVVCDYLEEGWPSMDLAGDMLLSGLSNLSGIAASRLRPRFRRRLLAVPVIGGHSFARNTDRLVNRTYDYPKWLRVAARAGYDVFHIVDHSYAHLVSDLPPQRTVVTCHDLDTFRCLLDPASEPRPHWFRAMTRRILDGLRAAAHVICVSRCTRDALLAHKLADPGGASVVYNGVDPVFQPVPDPEADREAAELLAGCGPYIVNVGSTIPRKNIEQLLRIFRALRDRYPYLVLVRAGGSLTSAQMQLAEQLDVHRGIRPLPFISGRVLAAVYRRAAAAVQTSRREGFGLPLIEALACGCPVIASDIPVFREIGEGSITLCDDDDAWVEAVAAAIDEYRSGETPMSARRRAAVSHARSFNWQRAAESIHDIYRTVVNGREARVPIRT
jgi:glycosyltransferase involved in cell wall biosynthesis